jgi:A/G-specific adenine glycosylase
LQEALLEWFAENHRALPWRENKDPYRVWLSEIMLQQTRVEAVKPYYARFLAALPDIRALSACEPDTLMKLWEGLGYYSRARNLQRAAQVITEKHSGEFPRTYGEIRALPGIGDYTAGAIASICFDLPEPAVDGNVLRVWTRLKGDSRCTDDQAVRRDIREQLRAVYRRCEDCGMLTQALMELGATVCTPRSPKCAVCPLRESCRAFFDGTVDTLPVKTAKKEKKLVEKTVFLLWYGDELALVRREETGLLGGMWSLPNVDEPLDVEGALRQAQAFGVEPASVLSQEHRAHVFTHIRWEMEAFTILCGAKCDRFVWRTPDEIRRRYALPTAFRKFL